MSRNADHDRDSQPCQVTGTENCCAEETDRDQSEVLLPPALHEMALTLEGAKKIRQILDDVSQPGYEGQEMPTADPSVLLKKVR